MEMRVYLRSAAIFILVIFLFIAGVNHMSETADAQGADTLNTAIHRACVQCYAVEGRYPPSVAYLQDYYGIQIDDDKYAVYYEGFASNIMPDITVVEL